MASDRKEYLREYDKAKYAQRKTEGVCVNCGGERAEGRTKCQRCIDTAAKRNDNKQKYDRCRAEGLCTHCGKVPTEKVYCDTCVVLKRRWGKKWEKENPEKRQESYQRRRVLAAEQGLCDKCLAKPAVEGRSRCVRCLQTEADRVIRRREAGLCTVCGACKQDDALDACDICRAAASCRNSIRNRQFKVQAFMAYGGAVCACCGETNMEFLQIDHVAGDGGAKRKSGEDGGGAKIYRQLRQRGWPPGYRVLCANCNWCRGLFGYCPHEKYRERTQATALVISEVDYAYE